MTDITLSVIASGILLVSTILAYQYLVHRVDGACEVKRFFTPKFDAILFILAGAAFVLAEGIFMKGFLVGSDVFMRAFMNAEVFIWLVTLGWIDFREGLIPNRMIGVGLLFWVVVVLIDIFVGGTPWNRVLVFSALGGFVYGGVLLVIALIVKKALGMGDVKLFFVLGLFYGVTDTYSILLFSILIMAIVSAVLLIMKKATPKTSIPMAPFVAVGFLISILAGL